MKINLLIGLKYPRAPIRSSLIFRSVSSSLLMVCNPGLPSKHEVSYSDQQKQISHDVSEILESVAELLRCAYKDDLQKFPIIFATLAERYPALYNDVKTLLVHSSDPKIKQMVDESLGNVVKSANKLSTTAKLFTSDPNSATKMFFSESAKNFSDELSNLLMRILSSKPGRQECENYKNHVKMTLRPMLELSDHEVYAAKTYLACVEDIQKTRDTRFDAAQKKLLDCIESEKKISNAGPLINEYGELLEKILKDTTQAAYILGMTDSRSLSGRSNAFREFELQKCVQDIKNSFEALCKNAGKLQQSDIDSFSKELTKNSATIAFCCKNAVNSLNGQPNTQKEILDIVNELNNSTKESLTAIKGYESCNNEREVKTLITKAKIDVMKPIENLLKLLECDTVRAIPSSFSDKGRQMQEPVLFDGLNFIDSVSALLNELGKLLDDYDPNTRDEIVRSVDASNKLADKLVETLKLNAPGESLLSELIQTLEESKKEIEKVKEQAITTTAQKAGSTKEYEDRLNQVITKMLEILDETSKIPASQSHLRAGKLETAVDLIANLPEIMNGFSMSLPTLDKADRAHALDSLLDLNNQLAHTVNACRLKPQKVGSENPKKLDPALTGSMDSAKKLLETLQTLAQKTSFIQESINNMAKLYATLNVAGNPNLKSTLTQKDIEKKLVENLKNVLKLAQEIPTRAAERSELLKSRCEDMLQQHEKCAAAIFDNSYLKQNKELQKDIRKHFIDLSKSLTDLLEQAKAIEATGADSEKKAEAQQQVKKISAHIANILKQIQSSHKGVQACSNELDVVTENVNELDTCILFADNKALEKEPDSPSLASIQPPLKGCIAAINTALTDLENVDSLTDAILLNFAKATADKAKQLFKLSKDAAISLGSNEADEQLSLLNAAKNLGNDMEELLKSLTDGVQSDLTDYKRDIVPRIAETKNSLGKFAAVFNKIDERVSSSSEAISVAISHIDKNVKYLNPNVACEWDNEKSEIRPEDVVRISKNIPFSCAKIVQALSAGKVKDLEDQVKGSENSFEELMKGVRKFLLASNEEIVKSVAESLKVSSNSYLPLLRYIQNNPNNPDMKVVSEMSKTATQHIFDFVKKCSDLKSEQFANMNDPQLLAERELLNAAASIELAAKKLAELKPRKPAPDAPNKDLDFEGQVLQAVQSIMKATSLLVTHASSAQKELVARGVLKDKSSTDTGQWSQGLISAARMVAESTHSLCDEAKNVVEGQGSEERMIGACNSIFASTSQLIMACKVKAAADSENQDRLEKAGLAVKKASKALIESLKGSGYFSKKVEEVEVDNTRVGGMKQMLDALEEVARREKELKEAREKLIKIRQAKPAEPE